MKFRKFKELSFLHRMAVCSGGSFMFGIILGYVLFPVVFKHQLKKEMSLRNKTDLKELWTTLPFPLDFKIWVWNVTNPMEAGNGEKPILKEVGPYVYEKWMAKIDLKENKTEDSIEYTKKDTYFFKPELSGGLTGDEIIYTPHLLLVGTIDYVVNEKPTMLKLVGKALHGIYKPQSVFMPHVVREMLFDGVVINCNLTDFAPKAVCNAYKEVESLDEFEPGFFRYSFFNSANHSDPNRFKVLRGIKNITAVGTVIEYGGKKSQDIWKDPKCDNFIGTDATVFRPLVTTKDELWTFSPEICRSLGAHYVEPSSYAKIKSFRFFVDLGDLQKEPHNHCFCPTPETCPPRGMMNIKPCVNGPIAISLPHFYGVDPKIQETVIGLSPDKEKHSIFLDFEPISGSPLFAKKRLQLNLFIPNVKEMDIFSKMNNDYVPLFWVEESLALNKTYINMLKYQLFYPMKAVAIIKWTTILAGIVGGIYTFILYRKENKDGMVRRPTMASGASRVSPHSAEIQPYNTNAITTLDKDAPSNGNSLPGVTHRY